MHCQITLPSFHKVTNTDPGIRIQTAHSKAKGAGNIPGNMESHGALAEGRGRDNWKTGWSNWNWSEWSTGDSRNWATRTHELVNNGVDSLICLNRLNISPYSNELRTSQSLWANLVSVSRFRSTSSQYTRKSIKSFILHSADSSSSGFHVPCWRIAKKRDRRCSKHYGTVEGSISGVGRLP